MHALGQLITDRMNHPQNRWSLSDVVKRMEQAGHHKVVGKSRLGQIRNQPVESIKGDVIFALADGLGVTPLTVANAALESMGIATRPVEVTDSIATISIDPSLSDTSRRALIALVREMREDPSQDSHDATALPQPARNEISDRRKARTQSDTDPITRESLLQHYIAMFKLSREYAHHNVMSEQAWTHLAAMPSPDATPEPEIEDALYVQFLAARLSKNNKAGIALQGGDPDLHEAVSLSDAEYAAAKTRFDRELAEMVTFGRLRTAGAPYVQDYIRPRTRAAAARTAPAWYSIGQSEHGDAGGEESQDPDGSR